MEPLRGTKTYYNPCSPNIHGTAPRFSISYAMNVGDVPSLLRNGFIYIKLNPGGLPLLNQILTFAFCYSFIL